MVSTDAVWFYEVLGMGMALMLRPILFFLLSVNRYLGRYYIKHLGVCF